LQQRDAESTVLTAPFAGRIATRSVEPFADVQAGQTLFEVDGDGPVEVVAQVPLRVAQKLREGAVVEARFGGGGGGSGDPVKKASITAISRRALAGDNVQVVARLTERMDGGPGPGAYAELWLSGPTSAQDMRLPIHAVAVQPGGTSGTVFVVENGAKVKARTVTLGALGPDGVAIESGVRPGEEVVATGVAFLRDGEPVRVLPALAR
jgi:RND family efflux transporter MFP subunit